MSDEKKCETLWAWVTERGEGDVSQVGVLMPETGTHTALTFRSRGVAEQFRALAAAHGVVLNQRVWLREFVMAKDHGDA